MKPKANERDEVLLTSTQRRLTIRQEFALAILPTAVVLVLLGFVEALSRERVIFASLASSAFLIYLDPRHPTNSVRSIVLSHLIGALGGVAANWAFDAGYPAAAVAMAVTIMTMIAADAVHPPSVGTSLTIAFRTSDVTILSLFMLCLAVIAVLVAIQNGSLRLLRRITAKHQAS